MTVQQEDITTIFVVGFPDDMKEREFQNLFTFAEDFEGAVLKIPSSYTISTAETFQKDTNHNNQSTIFQDCDSNINGNRRHSTCGASPIASATTSLSHVPKKQIIGFARFKTQGSAKKAIDILNGRKIDPERCSLIMKAEFAKKNFLPKRGSICVADYVHNIANIFSLPNTLDSINSNISTDTASSISNSSHSSSSNSSDYYSLSSISHLPPPPLPPMMLNTQSNSPIFQHRHSIHNYPYMYEHNHRLSVPMVLPQSCYPRMTPSYAPPHHQHKNHSIHSVLDMQHSHSTINDHDLLINDDSDTFGTSVPNFILSNLDNNSRTSIPQLHRSHSLVDMKLMNHSLLEDVEDCYQQHDSFLSSSNEPEELLQVTKDMFPFLDEDEEGKKGNNSDKFVSRMEKDLHTPISLSTIQEYGDEKTKIASDPVLFQPGFMSVFGNQISNSASGNSTSLAIRPPRHNYDDALEDSSRHSSQKHLESSRVFLSGRSLGSCEYRFLSDTPPPHLVSGSTNINQPENREHKIMSHIDENSYQDTYSLHSSIQQSCSGTPIFKTLSRMTGNDCDRNEFDDISHRDIESNDSHPSAPVVTSSNGITTVLGGNNGVPRIFRNGPNGVLYPIGENPPCNTLYVGNLPMTANEDELRELFQSCSGYKRLSFKMKPNGPMCFVEFDDVQCATTAMNELYGTMLTSSTKGGIRLSYSKNPLGVRPPGSLPKSLVNMIANQMMVNGAMNCHPGMIQHQGTVGYGGVALNHHSLASTSGLHSHNSGMYYPQSHGSTLYTHSHMYPHNLHEGQSLVPSYYPHSVDENIHGNFHIGYHEKGHDENSPAHDPTPLVITNGTSINTGEILNNRIDTDSHRYYYDNESTTIVS